MVDGLGFPGRSGTGPPRTRATCRCPRMSADSTCAMVSLGLSSPCQAFDHCLVLYLAKPEKLQPFTVEHRIHDIAEARPASCRGRQESILHRGGELQVRRDLRAVVSSRFWTFQNAVLMESWFARTAPSVLGSQRTLNARRGAGARLARPARPPAQRRTRSAASRARRRTASFPPP